MFKFGHLGWGDCAGIGAGLYHKTTTEPIPLPNKIRHNFPLASWWLTCRQWSGISAAELSTLEVDGLMI